MGRFQFSIRFLLLATAAVAAVCAEPLVASELATDCLNLLFATAAIFGVTQTNGKLRAFWIGTAVVLVPLAIPSVEEMRYAWPHLFSESKTLAHSCLEWPLWCAAPANGLFAVFLHWLFAPRKPPA
jgi:hypothetical protein